MLKRGLALLAVPLLMASACYPDEALPLADVLITLNMPLAQGEEDTMDGVLERFREETGGVVLLESEDPDELNETIRNEVQVGAAERTVHVFAQDVMALGPLVEEELVEDLSDVAIPEEIPQGAVPPQVDGSQYFLPFRPTARLTYVHGRNLEGAGLGPPATMEDLVHVGRELRESRGRGHVTLPLAEGDAAAVTLSEWIVGHGGNPLVLNDEGSAAAFRQLSGFWNEGLLAPESLRDDFDTEVSYQLEGITWLGQNWPFMSGVLWEEEEELPVGNETKRLIEDYTVYPGWSYPAGPVSVLGGEVLAIPRGLDDRQLEGAVRLAEYLMSEEVQTQLLQDSIWIPEDDEDEELPGELTESLEALRATLEHGWYRPNVPYWPEVVDALNESFRRIVVEGEPLEEVLDSEHERIAEAAEAHDAEYPP